MLFVQQCGVFSAYALNSCGVGWSVARGRVCGDELVRHAWVSFVWHAWVSFVWHAWVSFVQHAWVSFVRHAWVSFVWHARGVVRAACVG